MEKRHDYDAYHVVSKVEVTLTLELHVPLADIGKQALKAHLEDWAVSGGGCRYPEDPLFDGIASASCGAVKVLT